MPQEFFQILSQSAHDFQHIVWPIVNRFPIVGGGTLKPVEAVSEASFKDELDLLAGIDAWQIITNAPAIRGLASRVQWGPKPYNTFSIRYQLPSGKPTEFSKRLTSIRNKDNGHLFPHLTIQAYLDSQSGNVLSCAAIKTEDLFAKAAMLAEGMALENNKNPSLYGTQTIGDGTTFMYISWDYLRFHDSLAPENIFTRDP